MAGTIETDTLKADTLTDRAGTGPVDFSQGLKADSMTDSAGTGPVDFPQGLKADSMTDSAGTGAVDFPNGLTVPAVTDGSSAAAGEIGEVITDVGSDTAGGGTLAVLSSTVLTPGVWLVSVQTDFNCTSAITACRLRLCLNAATSGETGDARSDVVAGRSASVSSGIYHTLVNLQYLRSSSTTDTLNLRAQTDGAGGIGVAHTLEAIRIR